MDLCVFFNVVDDLEEPLEADHGDTEYTEGIDDDLAVGIMVSRLLKNQFRHSY